MAFKQTGVNLLDFELEKELTQPWTCLLNFRKKALIHGWKGIGWSGWMRFITCLSVSVCVILLAPAINTIGIPKERWFPNGSEGGWDMSDSVRRQLTITTPRMTFLGLDWMNYWNSAWNLVGSGPESWDAALAIAAASTYSLLAGLPNAYTNQAPGWWPVDNEIDGYITGINTFVKGSTVQNLSV